MADRLGAAPARPARRGRPPFGYLGSAPPTPPPGAGGSSARICGARGARFGTGIAAGIFEPTRRRGTLLSRNVAVGILSSLLTSFYLAALAKLVASAFGREAVISFWDLVTISVIGGVLASSITLVFTVGIAVMSFQRGWDLDAVSTPMVTAIGDMVTLPALFAASFIPSGDLANAVVAGAGAGPPPP